jgi:hypothetical protein
LRQRASALFCCVDVFSTAELLAGALTVLLSAFVWDWRWGFFGFAAALTVPLLGSLVVAAAFIAFCPPFFFLLRFFFLLPGD